MSKKTQIPIYRAKESDSDEYVEGYYYPCFDRHYIAVSIQKNMHDIKEDKIFSIDPSTLAISFDDGKTWREIEVYKNIDDVLDTYSKERIKMMEEVF